MTPVPADATTRPVPDDRRPLSPLQERLWFLVRLHPDAEFFTMPVHLAFDGALDVPALERALAAVVARHDVLAGRIVETDGVPAHLVEPWSRRLTVLDAGHRPPAQRLTGHRLLDARLVRYGPDRHVLELLVHHLAFDGLSTPVLIADLRAAYQGHELPPPALRHADFARWQREWVDGPECRAALERWDEALAGAEELVLATDRPRRAPLSFRGAEHTFTLGAELERRLRVFAAATGATLSMVLTAAFGVTMSRRSGRRSDVLIGIPHTARIRPEWAGEVGLFANMVPLRVRTGADPHFRDLVRSVRAEAIRCLRDGWVPLDRIVARHVAERDPSRLPLCPVSFQVTHDVLPDDRDDGGPAVRRLFPPRRASEFELSCFVADLPGLPVVIEYATDLFDPETVRDVGEEFRVLCDRLTAAPDRPVGEADHLGPRLAAAVAAATGPAPVAAATDLAAAFRAQAARTPDAPAVVGELTYRRLDADSDRLAGRLASAGIRRGDLVALRVGRHAGLVTAMLGVLKAGAAYLPVDDELPPARLRTMLDAVAPRAVVADRSHRARAEDLGLPLLDLDGPGRPAAPLDLSPADLAYVMFTSGTTGTPKPVAVPHAGVLSLAHHCAYAPLGPGDVVAVLAPAAFDASTFEIWAPLLSGAALAVAPDTRLTPGALHDFVRDRQVTVLHLTAGLLRVVADERPELFAGLRRLLTGGDVVPADRLHRISAAYPDLRITACYGPTEATVFATTAALDRPAPDRPVPLGRPIAGRSLFVLDPWGHPTAPGVLGDIHVGGDGLAHGYLGRPGLTADRFVPHPFEPGARLYRTGDLGRIGADGRIEFAGRSDRQVKVRGFRVEPAEVEAALTGLSVVGAAAVGTRVVAGERVLAAYVVPRPEAAADPPELRRRLAGLLPAYAVPGTIVVVPALPVTGNGKLDWSALERLAPDAGTVPAIGRSTEPTPTEALVGRIWAEVLGVPSPCVPDTDFFASGGHSIAALRVAGRLERELGLLVPLGELFARPTVRDLAAWIDLGAGPDGPRQPANTTVPEDDSDLLAELTGAGPADIAALLGAASRETATTPDQE
ncbi:amino acid adenylation domain-containing protein [Streptomyces sp. NPDC059604]|uniref:non-ribosomal peptide synthetase n=2 Tax=unclassified Streptomyces TaxID=2593676 RepID=UPI0036AFC122